MASEIRFGNRKSRGYRRRKPLPALIVIGLLGLMAMVIWIRAIVTKSDIDEVIRCTPAATPPAGTTFTPLGHAALDDAAPIAPDQVAVKVLNAGRIRGQALITTESLRQFGFSQVGQPDSDPAYPENDAKCWGQIRFGESGTSAARTLSLMVPCAELVKDNRPDASVDFAIGNRFADLTPTQQAREVLRQLTATSHPGGDDSSAVNSPVIDHDLLAAARDVTC
ncbi:envelope integrity protein Cei [Amycolatopsis pigmentata]|uniref:Envelope integrity protein Cei n=1 Tax=Amycolatopsis pigmentata TaxID=450801 RepID=A0ABW5FV63_9PSEU